MDCEKLVTIMKRWGYNAAYQYLVEVCGLTQKEAEECIKRVGIDLGHWPLYAPLGGRTTVHQLFRGLGRG